MTFHLIGRLEHELYVPIYWEVHHPNWLTHIFQRGWYLNHQPVTFHPYSPMFCRTQPLRHLFFVDRGPRGPPPRDTMMVVHLGLEAPRWMGIGFRVFSVGFSVKIFRFQQVFFTVFCHWNMFFHMFLTIDTCFHMFLPLKYRCCWFRFSLEPLLWMVIEYLSKSKHRLGEFGVY